MSLFDFSRKIIGMDYAFQLIVIIGMFTAAGMWARDNWDWPPVTVVVMMLLGLIAGVFTVVIRAQKETPLYNKARIRFGDDSDENEEEQALSSQTSIESSDDNDAGDAEEDDSDKLWPI